ncbi:hypothetical protein HDU84_000601 [Entophlyctis sp. JEL0112]|nr:hypothetical protein HDU84_000601 [Entophlyctis sp. JEL0112]
MSFKFGPFPISASEIFYASRLTFGLVNLKPVVPGHVLVIPRRVVPRFADLSDAESVDLVRAARAICTVIEREYRAESMTITIQARRLCFSAHSSLLCPFISTYPNPPRHSFSMYYILARLLTDPDGPAAGQTVPHVHVHIIPRRKGDWADNDDIYPAINAHERKLATALVDQNDSKGISAESAASVVKTGRVDASEDRPARTQQEMADEAARLRPFFREFDLDEGEECKR